VLYTDSAVKSKKSAKVVEAIIFAIIKIGYQFLSEETFGLESRCEGIFDGFQRRK